MGNYARAADCEACVLKPQCTTGKARGIDVGVHEPAREVAQELAGRDAHKRSRRLHQKVEVLFAHLKEQLGAVLKGVDPTIALRAAK